MLLWFSSRIHIVIQVTWSSCASVCHWLTTVFKKPSPYFQENEKTAFSGPGNKAYQNWNIGTHPLKSYF